VYNKYTNLGVLAATVILTIIAVTSPFQVATAAVSGHPLREDTKTVDLNKVVINHEEQIAKAPIATSGDNNVYVAWWSNKTGNNEVMFKASTDGGKTFGSKMNLSNSPKSESQDVQIAAAGNNVYVTWWERNQTMNEPVMKVSNDNGKTFGEKIMLSNNATAAKRLL
jgi:hypothetical protein